jgi:hypothetical protein
VASWFETRGVAALLTMKVLADLILRRRESAVSKDEAAAQINFERETRVPVSDSPCSNFAGISEARFSVGQDLFQLTNR